jgi:hypothetical protein
MAVHGFLSPLRGLSEEGQYGRHVDSCVVRSGVEPLHCTGIRAQEIPHSWPHLCPACKACDPSLFSQRGPLLHFHFLWGGDCKVRAWRVLS